ncbi:MAG TPA: sensor histidine kinase [Verrucomicrobiae bacterium]|nr:sensor histidine kinase [Verrucomicrobiae bacterium]
MHPILAASRRLAAYLLAWLPILVLLSLMAKIAGGLAWWVELAVLTPATLVFAFACLSPWYLCRAMPLHRVGWANLLGTFGAAAFAGSLVFVGSAKLVSLLVEEFVPNLNNGGAADRPLPLLLGMGVLLYVLSVGMHYASLAAEESRAAENRAAEARTLAREAELRALKMQINPHFLFNSLHSIAALATQDGPRARDMCVRLSEFLRSGLGVGDRDHISLREELALARNYLDVERVRFGDRLRVEETIDPDCGDCNVPPLVLQPLVENAVKHGIAGLVEGGCIRLQARRQQGGVCITIENPFDPEMPLARKSGVGLAHVRRRLEVRYGERAVFEPSSIEGLYRVVLLLPCESN